MITIVQKDAIEYIKICLDNPHFVGFDCIITDPPYDSLLKWQGIGTTARMGFGKGKDAQESDKFFPTINTEQMYSFLQLCYYALKPNTHCYIMCDTEYMLKIMGWHTVREKGLFSNAKPLIWDKVNMGMGYHWRCRHEYVVMLDKGKRRLNDLGKSDILTHKKVKGYPTEKPVGLYEELLLNSTNEGDTILDPFCGSGTLGEACMKNNRNAVLVDISDRAIQLSKERINVLV